MPHFIFSNSQSGPGSAPHSSSSCIWCENYMCCNQHTHTEYSCAHKNVLFLSEARAFWKSSSYNQPAIKKKPNNNKKFLISIFCVSSSLCFVFFVFCSFPVWKPCNMRTANRSHTYTHSTRDNWGNICNNFSSPNILIIEYSAFPCHAIPCHVVTCRFV